MHLADPIATLVERELDCAATDLVVTRPADGYLHETLFVSDGRREIVLKRFDLSLVGDLTVPLDTLVANTALAGRHGIGARVLRAEADVVLLEKLPGAPVEATGPDVLARVAVALRRLHDCAEVPANPIDFLAWSDDWLQSLDRAECPWTGRLRHLREQLDEPRRLAAALPHRPSFVHNDLLLANFIDDGERAAVIDYDFSGKGAPYFDLGCLFGNAELDPTARRHFIESYVTGDEDIEAALACAELHEILAVHANAVVFTWAAYGYPAKFGPIADEMEEVIVDHVTRTEAAVAEGLHRELAERIG